MSLHRNTEGMLKESLTEMLIAADVCIHYRKNDGGCLGYPAALLLFSIADSIGSYHRENESIKIKIDGKERTIDNDGFQHFFIFNSKYYNLQLSEKMIKIIYNNFRSLLVHNSVIPENHFLTIDDPLNRPFCENDGFTYEITGATYPSVHLVPLYQATACALLNFFPKMSMVVSTSKQLQDIKQKSK